MGTEEFHTAPGVAGTRWFSTIRFDDVSVGEEIVDISVDSKWQPVRIRIQTPDHHLILQRSGANLVGARDEEMLDLGPGADYCYRSPAFRAAIINRLAVGSPDIADIAVTSIGPGSLELSTSDQRYERVGTGEITTPGGRFDATRWHVSDRDTGREGDLWISGAVVLTFPGVAELLHFDPARSGPFPL